MCGRCRRDFVREPGIRVLADQGKVFSTQIPDCRKPILRAIIRGRLDPKHVPVDGWHGYDALVEAESPQPFRVENDHTVGPMGAQNIQSFWSFAQQRLQKFNGVPNRTFYLHLKESEWRFNFSNSYLLPQPVPQARSHMCAAAQTDSAAACMYSALLRLIEKHPL